MLVVVTSQHADPENNWEVHSLMMTLVSKCLLYRLSLYHFIKVSDDVKQKNSDNVDSKISRKSIDGALKNNKGNRSRSNSKGSSILAMSKPSQEESKV